MNPIPISKYAYAPGSVAQTNGHDLDLAQENSQVSIFLQENRDDILEKKYALVIVPGYTSLRANSPVKISTETKYYSI